ncbi:hypothetical protein [Micromonospora cathayae]|uniref:Uncharacterized protein n=1 Tax=Micromonospora cathayae TaxID=3028804 RepID=A0ABY7ZK49_9ACTN|nr:hypothetical protein [Micromonospora sp. HUAS 3]WDZ82662.1 hypothetical protein PVK37_19535 [Micromonospora sp. HUAS 3]
MRLLVREEVGVARDAEVVVCGVPRPDTPAGTPLVVRTPDGGTLPVQVLGAAGDWTAVAFPATVGPLGTVEYTLTAGTAQPTVTVRAVPGPDGVDVDTGAVRFQVRPGAVDPLAGLPGLRSARIHLVGPDGVPHVATCEAADVTVVHDGPLQATVRLTGRYRAAAVGSWAFQADVTATAGAGHVDLDLRVVNDTDEPESAVAEWRVDIGTAAVTAAECGVFDVTHRTTAPFTLRHRGQGHARGIFATAEVAAAEEADAATRWQDASVAGYHDRWEWAELHGRQATNWVLTETPQGTVTVAVHRFGENHPGDVAVGPDGITVRFWPTDAGELRMTQGAAKTRRLRVGVGADRRAGLRLDHPVVPFPADALDTTAVPRILPYRPDRYPHLEAHIREELFGWYQYGQSRGFHDLGDSVQGITVGPRTGYSANNEHDALYALTLHYLRSGERAYHDSAEAYADHLRDIDLIHHSTRNPYEVGGVRAHGRAHLHYVRARTPHGEIWTSVDTGHVWTEGLVLFGQVSGDGRYLDAARRIGDCLVRLHEIGWTRPEPGPRNSGWPLIALASLARATGEARYLDVVGRIARRAVAAQHPDGRWLMRLGLHDDYCAWQNAVLLTGLARTLEIADDPTVRAAFLAGCRALVDLGRNPDGTFVFLGRFDYRWANRSALIREALACAYDATGDDGYLRAGLHGGDRWYRAHGAPPALSNDIAEWRGHLPFLARAHDAGLLTDLGGA